MSGKSTPKAPPNCFWRDGSLWGRVSVKGREQRFSLRTRDAATAARRVEDEKKRRIGTAHYADGRLKYTEVVALWTDWIVNVVGGKTAQRYATSLKQLEPFLITLFFDEITFKLLGDVIKARLATGITMATVRRDLSALSSVFGYAIDESMTEINPAKARLETKGMKEKREPIALPRDQDIREVIKRAGNVFGPLTEAGWRTGCRIEELYTSKRDALDDKHKQLTVIGKGRKQRTLELVGMPTPDCYELFRKRPIKIGSQLIFWWDGMQRERTRAAGVDPDLILHPSRKYGDIIKRVKKEVEAEGKTFNRFTFHHLRHKHAVEYLKAGGNIYDLQHRLGHASITITEEYLKFLTPAEAARAKGAPSRSAAIKYAAVS